MSAPHDLRARRGFFRQAQNREEIASVLQLIFPIRVGDYLFDTAGHVRADLFDVSPLHTVITKHDDDLVHHIERTFQQNWPAADAEIVDPARLHAAVLGTAKQLEGVIRILKKRLDWCLDQMVRLDMERRRRGTLDPDEDALFARCDRLVKRLKGQERRRRYEAEGYDDTNTYGALAVEGFLPGYGLETGAIVGTAVSSRHVDAGRDFSLPRPPALALREYVPGNLIYANGHRFVARYFHLEADEPMVFQVDTAHEAVSEVGLPTAGSMATLGAAALKAVPSCDVDLAHVSHISDEEELRFQLPVAVYGYELDRHDRGRRYNWGGRDLILRRNVHLRLINVGAAPLVHEGQLSYPVCLVSGQSRSPFASRRELEEFSKHQEVRYGRRVERVGFYADVIADALSVSGCTSRDEAYSLLETLRVGMSQVVDMEREDLEVLVIGRPGSDEVDALLYDPMPGGSGLLDQACDRWATVVEAALTAVKDCPSACPRSCIDCLQTFRNAYFHRHLDRQLASERFEAWGGRLEFLHEVPARLPDSAPRDEAMPVNEAETLLRGMLQRAGFPTGEWHREIQLGRPLGATCPDVYFPGDDPDDPGVCVYLDGLSEHIHGCPQTASRDRAIRETLRSHHYEVFEIPASQLHDRDATAQHFFRLARVLLGRDTARSLRDNPAWFEP